MQSITVCMMPTDLLALDIYDMTTGTLADRVAGCAEII